MRYEKNCIFYWEISTKMYVITPCIQMGISCALKMIITYFFNECIAQNDSFQKHVCLQLLFGYLFGGNHLKSPTNCQIFFIDRARTVVRSLQKKKTSNIICAVTLFSIHSLIVPKESSSASFTQVTYLTWVILPILQKTIRTHIVFLQKI